MDRTIRIKGTGKLSVMPDLTRVCFSLTGTYPTYEQAVSCSGENTNRLKDDLARAGFPREDVKTVDFSILPDYESYQTKDKAWKRRLNGYRFRHEAKLEFPSDSEKLGRVLKAANSSAACPAVDIEYTVSEPEKLVGQVLEKAVQDAAAKAEVIARAAGIRLGRVLSVSNTNEEDRYRDPVICMDMIESCKMSGPDLTPEDMDLTGSVTVIWEIEG